MEQRGFGGARDEEGLLINICREMKREGGIAASEFLSEFSLLRRPSLNDAFAFSRGGRGTR